MQGAGPTVAPGSTSPTLYPQIAEATPPPYDSTHQVIPQQFVAPQPVGASTQPTPPSSQQGPSGPQFYDAQFKGMNMQRRDQLGTSDFFFILKASTVPGMEIRPPKQRNHGIRNSNKKKTGKKNKEQKSKGGGWVVLYKSEVVSNTLNPTWLSCTVDVNTLVHGNYEQPFVIEVWNHDSSTSHEFVGGNRITLGELLTTKEVQLYNAQRLGFENKPVGKLEVLSCEPKTLSASGGGASNM